LIRAVGIVIALGPVTSLGTAMLAPEARHISTAVTAITDFTAITTDLDPFTWTVTEPI
jgi:hypothetical protein